MEGDRPVPGFDTTIKELNAAVGKHRLLGFQQFQVISVHLGGTGMGNQVHVDQAAPIQLLKTEAETLFVTAVAGNEPTVQVPDVDRIGDAVKQGPLESQLIVQLFFGPEPMANLYFQTTAPRHRYNAQQNGQGNRPVDPEGNALPQGCLGNQRAQPLHANGPQFGDGKLLQRLVEDVQQLRFALYDGERVRRPFTVDATPDLDPVIGIKIGTGFVLDRRIGFAACHQLPGLLVAGHQAQLDARVLAADCFFKGMAGRQRQDMALQVSEGNIGGVVLAHHENPTVAAK